MKIINDWPSHNELNIPAADPPVLANGDTLYHSFYDYYYESVSVGLRIYLPAELDKFYVSIVLFYYRLTLLAEDNFYEDS
jgi:hypothetical protein